MLSSAGGAPPGQESSRRVRRGSGGSDERTGLSAILGPVPLPGGNSPLQLECVRQLMASRVGRDPPSEPGFAAGGPGGRGEPGIAGGGRKANILFEAAPLPHRPRPAQIQYTGVE